jgi:hypothetical protein
MGRFDPIPEGFYIKPENNEIEISVFGPGYGECVLLHAGDNNWIIVDSCIDQNTGKPSSVWYFEQIGVLPSSSVKLIVATHWHDDHIRGLGETLNVCKSAKFACSCAMGSYDFFTLLAMYKINPMMKNTGMDEFKSILRILEERKQNRSSEFQSPIWAIENMTLWKNRLSSLNEECLIYALSPSHTAYTYAMNIFLEMMPDIRDSKRRLTSLPPNRAAIVLWVSIGSFSILLGSDLQEENNPKMGWTAIVNSSLRPEGSAGYFKIPHHGSCNAHNVSVWENMINRNHTSVLTPFYSGGAQLPTHSDIERICSFSDNAFTTARSLVKKAKRRSSTVEKTIKESVKSLRQIHMSTGQVRFRIKPLHDPTIELFGDAMSLNNLVNAKN